MKELNQGKVLLVIGEKSQEKGRDNTPAEDARATTVTSTTVVLSTTTELQVVRADYTIFVVVVAAIALVLAVLLVRKERKRQ